MINSLEDLYVDELKDLYNAENQLIKALPKMAKSAESNQLRMAFEEHLDLTKEHAARLEQIFQMHDMKARGKKCMGMEGIIEEGKEMLREEMEPHAMDAALISAAQKVEHYEMASYGTVRTWAQELGLDEEADLLQLTLDEEGEADKKLTRIAESSANVKAEMGDGNMQEQGQMERTHTR